MEQFNNKYVRGRITAIINEKFEPSQINPLALLEGQTLTDLLREIDTREPEAVNYSQQVLEVPIDYFPATTPPVEPTVIAIEPENLAF